MEKEEGRENKRIKRIKKESQRKWKTERQKEKVKMGKGKE